MSPENVNAPIARGRGRRDDGHRLGEDYNTRPRSRTLACHFNHSLSRRLDAIDVATTELASALRSVRRVVALVPDGPFGRLAEGLVNGAVFLHSERQRLEQEIEVAA